MAYGQRGLSETQWQGGGANTASALWADTKIKDRLMTDGHASSGSQITILET
jgi:hypothetical protein